MVAITRRETNKKSVGIRTIREYGQSRYPSGRYLSDYKSTPLGDATLADSPNAENSLLLGERFYNLSKIRCL
ncbi:hypothetical protein KIN20_015160 [Parelaphostrongylus tenuis]|uniref:Uncharacterized protein n=1 Tax=Parelaphostrongylus tenuis TaxID=148309 RepID=A0AAD5MFQ0_PARTN|nr:hypothetical protein KIN20_015160 [Parelaphostrongylus tenuis]